MCESHTILVSNAIEFRRQGMPINIALNTIQSAMNNRYLYLALRWSIEMAYSAPDDMAVLLNNGHWLDLCELALLNPRKFTNITGYGFTR